MKVKKILAVATALAAASMSLCAVGCSDEPVNATPTNTDEYIIPQDYCRTYYEVFVRSFADGNGDGIGDLRGLANNLDYLNDGDDSTTTDLGINGIWMMPINSSPSYHKYDVSDYYGIDDEYGTMEDLEYLVEECNKRDIWLQMDLVLNHTSSDHPWFKEAVALAQEVEREGGILLPEESLELSRYDITYSETKPAGNDWRSIPGTSNYYYYAHFSTNMPELNLSSEEVREEIKNIVDFWLGKGIRSFRLDAVPWACAQDTVWNEANNEFWTWFNEYCNEKGAEIFGKEDDGINSYCYNVGEVWTSSSTTIERFFSTGMSSFNYGFADSASGGFAGIVNERKQAAAIMEALENTQKNVLALDPDALLSNFLTNHDNDRSADNLLGDVGDIKKGAALYLLAPGNPYIYYGEEIGALGSGADENKRIAFNWGDNRKVKSPNGAIEENQRYGSVKSQTTDANSILTYYRNAIKIRNRFPEIGRGLMTAYALNGSGELTKASDIRSEIGKEGSFYSVNTRNMSIAAYTLTWNDREVLIVHNVGKKESTIKASAFADHEVVATLKANGGSVSFANGNLTMSGGTVAVLKIKTATAE